MQGGGDGSEGVAAAGVRVCDIHYGLEVACEGDCHRACGRRRRPETEPMPDAAGEEPTGEEVGAAEAEVVPAVRSAGAPRGEGQAEGGWFKEWCGRGGGAWG